MSPDLILNTVPGWLFLGAFLCLCLRQLLVLFRQLIRLLRELEKLLPDEPREEATRPVVKRTSTRAVVPGQIKRSRPKNRASAPEENQ